MKKLHIVLLVCIAVAIGVLVSFMGSLTTYDTVDTAKKKPGKFVHLIAKLDQTSPVQYDEVKNPNYTSFIAVDSLGSKIKVEYFDSKPANLEHSQRLVLKGRVDGEVFKCDEILMKCPSKYKDDMKAAKQNLETASQNPQ